MKFILTFITALVLTLGHTQSSTEATIGRIIEEAGDNSQLEQLAHELLDVIGPRLVGTPQTEKAHHWAVEKFRGWGITAENKKWGEWRGWERGITHIDLLSPRVRTLEGTQLAWSPSTRKKGITAPVIALPEDVSDSIGFARWLPQVKGKFVLASMPQPTGRPDYNWEEWATEASFEKMKEERREQLEAWRRNINATGYDSRSLRLILEDAGAAGIIESNWSRAFGTNKIFGTNTKKTPTIDLALEDYGLLYRLQANGHAPEIRVVAESRGRGAVPTFNTIAKIEGGEKADEYVLLSAHFDSWDGGSGATDNGSGTITMMEVARILKKVYPNPRRTILIGLWGSEEQGLNGSRAFAQDHPDIVDNIQVVFNQDNGTGRIESINGQGFLHAYDYLGRWLQQIPQDYTRDIETTFPGTPWGGGSDHASFVAAGVPAFMLISKSWSYGTYTWHTHRDTYDKLVFDDLKNNVILIAALTWLASEDPERASGEKRVMPVSRRTGEPAPWPEQRDGNRRGMLDE